MRQLSIHLDGPEPARNERAFRRKTKREGRRRDPRVTQQRVTRQFSVSNDAAEPANMPTETTFADGWFNGARRLDSPNFDERPAGASIDVVVLHHISLPAGCFEGDAVERLFLNRIAPDDRVLGELATIRVSAHFFIRRNGELLQFVSIDRRAWHAGVSAWRGRERVNDFSVGIEIEGDSDHAFSEAQYASTNALLTALRLAKPSIALTTHAEIAFGRKVDPGQKFDFSRIFLGQQL
jgi:N-acetyl-anhydromuramoyl-L-alanine amidase